MAITPQAIKDQEFQKIFRGYDTIEVKAYLELIAEEFFEQLEEVRSQGDTIEALEEEKEELVTDKKLLEEKVTNVQEEANKKIAAYSNKDDAIILLEKECDALKEKIEKKEAEKAKKDIEIASEREKAHEKDVYIQKISSEKSELEKQVAALTKQIDTLDAVEVDFKSTLIMAQKFSNDIKQKSEAEAQEIIDLAIEESEKQRQETFAELSRYPKEIEVLKEKRDKVRKDLEKVLNTCLNNLNVFNSSSSEDDEDLFQSILLPSDDEEEKLEFDDLSVDFSAPQSKDDGDTVVDFDLQGSDS